MTSKNDLDNRMLAKTVLDPTPSSIRNRKNRMLQIGKWIVTSRKTDDSERLFGIIILNIEYKIRRIKRIRYSLAEARRETKCGNDRGPLYDRLLLHFSLSRTLSSSRTSKHRPSINQFRIRSASLPCSIILLPEGIWTQSSNRKQQECVDLPPFIDTS